MHYAVTTLPLLCQLKYHTRPVFLTSVCHLICHCNDARSSGWRDRDRRPVLVMRSVVATRRTVGPAVGEAHRPDHQVALCSSCSSRSMSAIERNVSLRCVHV